jgi:hypothetical protein
VLIGLAVVIALAMIGALARALVHRAPRTDRERESAPPRAEALAAAIAALDARHEAGDPMLDKSRYATQRAELKAQLAAALATENASA